MILVTVGSQLPFDRMVRLIDEVAPALGEPVFAQVGNGTYRPVNIESAAMIRPSAFDDLIDRASLIVSHAGIGTILMAQKRHKPLLLFPRRAAFGEHRNDHQLATVAAMRGRKGIYVVETDGELQAWLRERPALECADDSAPPQRQQLKDALAEFLAQQVPGRR